MLKIKFQGDGPSSGFKIGDIVAALAILLCLVSSLSFIVSASSQARPTRKTPRRQRPSQKPAKEKVPVYDFRDDQVMPQEVLVKFRDPLTSFSTQDLLKRIGDVDNVKKIGSVPNLYLLHSRTRSVRDLLKTLLPFRSKEIVYVEPNFIIHLEGIPNDGDFGKQWGLQNKPLNLGGIPGKDISAVPAWSLFSTDPVGSRAIVVGVIDTGIDYHHPDLANNIWRANTNYNLTVGDLSIRCDEGTHGYNFTDDQQDCNPMDNNNHGTRIAGIIGAEGNNNLGMTGVNWTTSIMPIKAFDAEGNSTAAIAAQAIDFAIQVKKFFETRGGGADVRVLNNSYGWYARNCSCQSLRDEIDLANNSGMLFVASAGNDGLNTSNAHTHYPSGFGAANVISVAAFNRKGNFASFSNFGDTSVDLAAPGQDIYSTITDNRFSFAAGTSFAAPFVTGAAALVLARCPELDTVTLKSTILSSVDKVTIWRSTPTTTNGRLNIYKALKACRP